MLRFFTGILILLAFITCGCNTSNDNSRNTSIVLYSEINTDFTAALAAEYTKATGVHIHIVKELKDNSVIPDIILAEHEKLISLKEAEKLQPFIFSAGDRLPLEFKDQSDNWYGIWYDPVVFMINQQFARKIGQENLKSWNNLEDSNARIVIENLSNTESTQNFLAAFAAKKGESIALNYLYNINKNIEQYVKFPFTSIRMAAVGDADIAITRRSYVFKYLENDFPAYIIYPQEGAPINLYGAGIFEHVENKEEAIKFIDWLITSDVVKKIALENRTGFLSVLPQGIDGAAVNPDKAWINNKYLIVENKSKLIDRWLETVRFSNK